jgi:hypothetical protein
MPSGDFYISLKHRNSIQTWSANPVSITPPYTYDFSDNSSKAFGNNMATESGVYLIYSGDANQDGAVDGLDMIMVDNQAANFGTGYVPEDMNGDGSIDALDMIVLDNNAAIFISAVMP